MPKSTRPRRSRTTNLCSAQWMARPRWAEAPAPDGLYSRHEYHHRSPDGGAAKGVGRALERWRSRWRVSGHCSS